MMTYIIFRTGSNAANQSMTAVAAVGIQEATSALAALADARKRINCYANQWLDAKPSVRCKQADREAAREAEEARSTAATNWRD